MKKFLLILAVLVALAAPVFAQSDLLTNTNYATTPGWSKEYPAFVDNYTAVSTTNGQTLYLFGGARYVLSCPTGQTATVTNTISTPFRVAGLASIRVAASCTNIIKIADAPTVSMGTDFVGGTNDTLVLDIVSTGLAVRVGGNLPQDGITRSSALTQISTNQLGAAITNVWTLDRGRIISWTTNGATISN